MKTVKFAASTATPIFPMINANIHWQPSASLSHLKQRAQLNQTIREFFAQRNVMEVETPILSRASITDVHLGWLETHWQPAGAPRPQRLFMHTSPEFAMKRLLCAGSGDIYQMCKVFRDDDCGRFHNPEFTMLEWYRLGFDEHQLMQEVAELLYRTLACAAPSYTSYKDIFLQTLAIDPFEASIVSLAQLAAEKAQYVGEPMDRDQYLQLLFSICIEPTLGLQAPSFIYDFPASQAALAKLNANDDRVASRFEVYVQGIELANGFYELNNAAEQRQRFEQDNAKRQLMNKVAGEIDQHFLAAVEHGLPDCAGVALGVDRLLMLMLGVNQIKEVLSFSVENA